MASAMLRDAALKSPKQLYKFLLRECERLPKDAQGFYKHSVKQSFKQHVIEPDKERVRQIMEKAVHDANWIVKKKEQVPVRQSNERTATPFASNKIFNSFGQTMEFETIVRQNHGIGLSQFSKAVNIWCRNPQTINRRILASVELTDVNLSGDIFKIFERIDALDTSSFLVADYQNDSIDSAKLLDATCILDQVVAETAETPDKTIRLYVTKQLPRVPHIFSVGIEFFLFDGTGNRVIIIHKPLFAHKQPLGPRIAYTLQQEVDGYTSIGVYRLVEGTRDSSVEWLEEKLFPRILKWATSDTRIATTPLSSLGLISAEKYAELYCKLKEKYGAKLISDWPENTDPMKFVYEDIAIATYLLLLWEKERSERKSNELQSFLDLGCGNGLLVYILFSEGHRGSGIDLRRRKIWDLYPPEIPLQVSTVVPSSATVYPEVDWIIGNHSDELTPWIPIIAARSSNDCRFFLLPCCPYELNGAKYQRHYASKSQYSEYIDYVKSLCVRCGFRTYIDKLRIPSTKRICLVGWDRMREDAEKREDRIREILSTKTTLTRRRRELRETVNDTDGTAEEWTCDFKPRDKVEKVRNCTQLDRALIKGIVDIVSNELLQEGRIMSPEGSRTNHWNAGRCLELCKVAASIPKQTMLRLRNECGGLQTLLKNHSHIFRVARGKVEFRMPGTESVQEKPKKRKLPLLVRKKTKLCWFYENHPDGCPVTEAACNYKHQKLDQ